jgi:serine/threonine protein kinase
MTEFNKELAILVQVRHPYCIMFYGACIQDPNYFIVTEYLFFSFAFIYFQLSMKQKFYRQRLSNVYLCRFCSNGTLTDFVRNRKVTSLNYWKIIYGMAIGIDYLHSRTPQLIHRLFLQEYIRKKIYYIYILIGIKFL